MKDFISEIHKRVREGYWPQNIREQPVPYKQYLRFPRTKLPAAIKLAAQLQESIVKRKSFSKALSFEGFSAEEIGTLLGTALGVEGSRRHYPSGGGLYPVETYVMGNVLEGSAPAAFHYHPVEHALEFLIDMQNFSSRDYTRDASPAGSMLVVFTSVWARSSVKYGSLSYLHAAIESGHMAQNILLTAAALKIPACPIQGFRDEPIREVLDLPEGEDPLYCIVLAKGLTKTA